MTLREEIAAMETRPIQSHIVHPQTAYRQAVLDVLAVVDTHDANCRRRIALLAPAEELSEARKLGYRLGIMDAVGIYEGRITKDSSEELAVIDAPPNEERPARDVLELYGSSEAHIGRAIVEAIDHATEVQAAKHFHLLSSIQDIAKAIRDAST